MLLIHRRPRIRKLQDTQPVWHAVIWIAIYIVAVNIGDAVGQLLRFEGMTSIVLAALSVILFVYVRTSGRAAFYGLRRVQAGTLPLTLWYLPLFAVAFVPYWQGIRGDLGVDVVLFTFLLVAAVGFVEELLFRGFLLRALRTEGSTTWAVIISGVTFGIGHVVNLLRGYAPAEQAVQIVTAILIGIALAYCVVLTGSILPGVAFHALFNLSAAVTAGSERGDLVTAGVIAVVMIPYIAYLGSRLAKVGAAADPASASGGS